ncbi:MAG: hypothetical protein QXL78_01355 [Methanocellales archaeon]
MHQKGLKKAEQKAPLEQVTKGCLAVLVSASSQAREIFSHVDIFHL